MQLGARGGIAVLAGALASCQAPVPDAAPRAAPIAAASIAAAPIAAAKSADQSAGSPVTPIDWAGAGDCLDQLRLVRAAAQGGRLDKAQAPPFAVVRGAPTTSLASMSRPIGSVPSRCPGENGPTPTAV